MKLLVAERLSGAPQSNGRIVRSLEDRRGWNRKPAQPMSFTVAQRLRLLGSLTIDY